MRTSSENQVEKKTAPWRKTRINRKLSRFIGERIRAARLEAGLTQKMLRRELHRSAIWMIGMEKGYTQIRALDLFRIAEATGKKVGWFVP